MAKQQYVLIDGAWVPTGGAPGAPGAPGLPGPEGPLGPPGTAYLNSQWDFNQNTAVSPANGTMRMDATTYEAVTQLWISELDRDNLDRHLGLDLCVPGNQIIMQSAQGRAVWDVTSHADSGTYRTIGVTLAESSGSRPSAGSKTTLYFVTTGTGGGGSTILSGTATPTAGTGAVGDYYLDTDDRILYGPKVVGGLGPSQSAFTNQTYNGSANYSGWSVGSDVTFAQAGWVTGVRYYRHPSGTSSSKTMRVWSSGGVLLATIATSGDTGTGWKTGTLSTPLAVEAGQKLRVGFDAMTGDPFAITDALPGNVVNGDLTITKLSFVNTTGIGYPTTQSGSSNYLTDVVFGAGAGPWPVALKSVPPGGTTGQVLKKTSGTDYDATWGTDTLLLTTPNILWQVPDILAWLTGHGVTVDNPNLSKPELLAIAADLLEVT